ncbi:hypothetical protein A2U01_0101185, partial [Trifolium medium]|nr:hypothetical protein [Trifolium medium]
ATRSNPGRSLLQGGSTQNLPAWSDVVAQEDAEVVADNLQAPGPFLLQKEQEKQGIASFFLGCRLQLPGVC